MTPQQLKLAAGIAIAASLVFAGWTLRGWHSDSVKLAIEEVKDEVSASTAKAIAEIKVENKTITAKTIERIKTETVYRDCVADEKMMIETNKARGF